MTSISKTPDSVEVRAPLPFSRLVAVVIGIEDYRKPARGQRIPKVEYADADADAFAATLREIYADVETDIEVLKDSEATLAVLKETLRYEVNT